MEIIRGHENLNPRARTVTTIGTFDGLHVGHRRIISETVAAAQKASLPSLLLTFDVHPRQVLGPHEGIEILMTLDDKLEELARFELDYVCVMKFRAIARLSAEDFCRRILIDAAKAKQLFVGANFRFGAGAAGDVAWLRENCADDFTTTDFPLETTEDTAISSTKIRDLLKKGEVEKIPLFLGRFINLSGRVVRGAGRGGGLGFPTANLEFAHGLCLPGRGVYTGYLHVKDLTLPAVINCGTNPTFDNGDFHCEAHVLDYHADLYGSNVKLELTTRLRDEKKFPSPEALSRQITDDVHRAREWFERQKRK